MNALDLAYDYGRTKVVQILRAKMKDYDDSKVEVLHCTHTAAHTADFCLSYL